MKVLQAMHAANGLDVRSIGGAILFSSHLWQVAGVARVSIMLSFVSCHESIVSEHGCLDTAPFVDPSVQFQPSSRTALEGVKAAPFASTTAIKWLPKDTNLRTTTADGRRLRYRRRGTLNSFGTILRL